jgi:hypothetical protein
MKLLTTFLFLFIISFCIFSITSISAQSTEKIKIIRATVERINRDSVYTIKTLDNEYFLAHEGSTDNGQELSGYFKAGDLKKMIFRIGLSYAMRTTEYYFSDNQLIFVFEKEENYPELKDSLGEFVGLDLSKLEPAFEGRYYFDKAKMTEAKITGKQRITDEGNREQDLLEVSAHFAEQLKTANSIFPIK